jgi:hypothetical protein
MAEPSLMDRIVLAQLRQVAREHMRGLIAKFSDLEEPTQVADAIARGALDGVADWLLANLGRRSAYDILQQRADLTIEGALTGEDHHGTKSKGTR